MGRRAAAFSPTVWLLVWIPVLVVTACGGDSPVEVRPPAASQDVCTGFAAWQGSAYVLPYPVGDAYEVNQANCSGFGHSGAWRYGYDFIMPIGSTVTASRDGVVTESIGRFEDGDGSGTNLVIVEHADGTSMLYSHFTLHGNLVAVGDEVRTGQPIGLSGNSGFTGGLPHLHVSLHTCGDLPDLASADRCPTLPVTFRNTAANPQGLQAGVTYTAGPR